MAVNLKVKLEVSRRRNEEGIICYQISDEQETRKIQTGYRLFPNEWNKHKAQIVVSSLSKRKEYLLDTSEKIVDDIHHLEKIIIHKQKSNVLFSINEIIQHFARKQRNKSFQSFAEQQIELLQAAGKVRTSETYKTTLNSFMKFRKGNSLTFEEINQSLITAYESWLKDHGISMNTISFYMRILRAIYNRAVDHGLTEQCHPFRHAYTGNEKTIKRAIPLEAIKQLKLLSLDNHSPKTYARDLFLFSFYTRGMSFIDMAFLKKTDLHNGILTYRRKKTGQLLSIKWEPCMQDIVDRYNKDSSPYLLPIIREPGSNERKQFMNEEHRIIRNLKSLGKSLGLSNPLTMYVARHAWASIAKSKNIPIPIIRESLGHDSEKTTQIYLSTLDSSLIDNANKLIINLL